MSKKKKVGILTAGGDCPGLNAAIRGFGKAAIRQHDMELIGIQDGFLGLAGNRTISLDPRALSGILTVGGTILGTSRDKVNHMIIDGEERDMVPTIVENYEKLGLDALVTLGGGGTAKNAYKLAKAGLNVLHLPKTIDNDIVGTDDSFGFSTALEIPTTASSSLRSWATVPAGWPSARASLVALTSSCCPRCPTSWTPSSRRWKTGKSRG